MLCPWIATAARAASRKARVALTPACATGMRMSEVAAIEIRNIGSGRMVIRIEHGKGAKDRYAMLSERLLGILRAYWVLARPKRFSQGDSGRIFCFLCHPL